MGFNPEEAPQTMEKAVKALAVSWNPNEARPFTHPQSCPRSGVESARGDSAVEVGPCPHLFCLIGSPIRAGLGLGAADICLLRLALDVCPLLMMPRFSARRLP